MKKIIFTVFACILLILGCSKSEKKADYLITEDSPVFSNGEIFERQEKSEERQKATASEYDVDLTKFNYNMIAAITYEIIVSPAKYKDKTVKIKGKFSSEVFEGIRYFGALVWDPTGCCPAGMDFIPPDGMNYPDDFPENGKDLTVTGKLKMVNDSNGEHLRLFADKIIF